MLHVALERREKGIDPNQAKEIEQSWRVRPG
jgi:hypothetical protein